MWCEFHTETFGKEGPIEAWKRPRVNNEGWIPQVSFIMRFFEKSHVVKSDAYYHILADVVEKYRPPFERTAYNCGPLLLPDNTSPRTTIQTKKCFNFKFYFLYHGTYRPIWMQTMFIEFFLCYPPGWKIIHDADKAKMCLNECLLLMNRLTLTVPPELRHGA